MTEETIKALAEEIYHTKMYECDGHPGSPYPALKAQKEAWIKGYIAALSGTEAMKVLESLTPGGSEYYNDPKACADFIRDNRDGLHKQIVDLTRKLKASTERVECYLPVDKVEFGKEIEKDGAINLVGGRDLAGKPRWLKKTVLTVVPNHQ